MSTETLDENAVSLVDIGPGDSGGGDVVNNGTLRLGKLDANTRVDAEILIPTQNDYIGGLQPNLKTSLFDIGVGAKHTVYQKDIARWKDPLTLPQSRMECVQWASGDWPWGGGWKTCTGHKYQLQWMYVTAQLRVDVASEQDLQATVERCLQEGAVMGALSGILNAVAGNPGALQAAVSTFVAVLQDRLSKSVPDLVSVNVNMRSAWGDWE